MQQILVWIAKQDQHFLPKWEKHRPEGKKMCPYFQDFMTLSLDLKTERKLDL